jgi:hypothetical protein
VSRSEFFVDGIVSHAEECERAFHAVYRRAVRIATTRIAMLVMTSMLTRPPYRPALIGGASDDIEEETRECAALEGGMGCISMQAHRHTYPYAECGE